MSLELKKDERVRAVSTTVVPSADASSLAITLRVTPVDPEIGDFELVLSVTSAGVLLDAIRRVG